METKQQASRNRVAQEKRGRIKYLHPTVDTPQDVHLTVHLPVNLLEALTWFNVNVVPQTEVKRLCSSFISINYNNLMSRRSISCCLLSTLMKLTVSRCVAAPERPRCLLSTTCDDASPGEQVTASPAAPSILLLNM